ncbi:Kremen protein 1 [Sphaceloma murrayae]|uniref:Kremen protein 1 n=1 Tax=Sphaceloma murrayae TaxID=2082308 RepID=A0A2K1R098_9PEZI|nr:Kremen protein 1 [Sphaceloma murrayae]
MHLSLSALALTFLSLSSFATADITSALATTTAEIADPTPAAAGSAPGAGLFGYEYAGCYNETTGYANAGGVRALNGGSMNSNNSQTTESCLTFCKGNSYQYCGIEYGRECWGGPYLSSLSKKLDESNCSIGCGGNNTEVCGGRLTLSLYNMSKTGSSGSGSKEGAATKDIAGAIGAVLLAGLMGAAFSLF